MGKYMRRKCGGADGDGKAAQAAVMVGGVRTRSRSAAAAVVVAGSAPAKKRKQEATTTAVRLEEDASSSGPEGGAATGCYLHLRSRRLFMPAAVAVARRGDLPVEEDASTTRLANSGASGEAIAVGVSRCASTASSTVDVAARARSGGDAEASERRDVESSVSDSECGGRESNFRRETTPSSRPLIDYISDLESSQATEEQKRNKRCRRSMATTTTTSRTVFNLQSRARMPAAAEIEEFFDAAERAQAERFAAKYNFDVALGVPLNAGRFEWTPVATI